MNSIPNLTPLYFHNTSNKFEHKKITATAITGLSTYPMYYGYRTMIHGLYKNIPAKESLKNFLNNELRSLRKFPFLRPRHLREMTLFHLDNACCDMAQHSINNNNFKQLGSVLVLTTLFSSLEIKQLGYPLSVMGTPNLFIPIMIRQTGTLAGISCGKLSSKDPYNPLYIQLPLAFGILSTTAQNIFLKNVSTLSKTSPSKKSSNINTNYKSVLNNSLHFLKHNFTKRNANIFVGSCVSRALFSYFSGALYEYTYKY